MSGNRGATISPSGRIPCPKQKEKTMTAILLALLGTGKWLVGCLLGSAAYFKWLLAASALMAL